MCDLVFSLKIPVEKKRNCIYNVCVAKLLSFQMLRHFFYKNTLRTHNVIRLYNNVAFHSA